MSDEHVFASWVSALFGDVGGQAEVWNADEGIVDSWSGTAFQDVLHIVCERCNNKWMSRLERKVSTDLGPMMLTETETTLSVPFQDRLAAWAVKTALVADHLPPIRRLVPEAQYGRFYAIKKALPAQAVWIAHRRSFNDTERPEDLLAQIIRQEVSKALADASQNPTTVATNLQKWHSEGRRAYRCTFAVGHFVCQVFGHDFPITFNVDVGADNDVVRQIWPIGSTFSWPPPAPVETIGGVEGLHRAFDGPPDDLESH